MVVIASWITLFSANVPNIVQLHKWGCGTGINQYYQGRVQGLKKGHTDLIMCEVSVQKFRQALKMFIILCYTFLKIAR